MAVHLWYLVVTFLLSLQYTDAGGSCQENIYLEVGKQGVLSCHFENFDIIGWINGDGDVTNTSPFIYMEGSQIYGQGYRSGDYDMHPNGSLIINEVKLTNEFNYTVLFVPHPSGANEYFEVPVKVYGGSCQENIYLEVGKQGVVSCHFVNCDIIGWIHVSGDVTKTAPFIYMEGSQIYGQGYRSGDYDMHPNGSLIINEVKLTNEVNYTVLFVPHPTGTNKYFEVPVKVYVPPDPGYPMVNGQTIQVIVQGDSRGFINCSLTGIRPRVHLEWVASPDEISLKSSHIVTDNSDGTYNTYLTSSYKVVNSPTGRVSIICRVAGQMADLFPLVTTVYLLLEQHSPVVNGLVHQQHVVLNVNREDKLTCTMNRVSQTMVLEWVFTPPVSHDEILIENELSKTDNRDDGTSNITLSSSFRVLSQSIHYVTLECRVVDENDGSQHDVTTVALLFDKITDQECESLLNWQLTLAIVLLVFLVVNVIIFWLIVIWIQLGKDFARKYDWVVTNPTQRNGHEAVADLQSVQEMQPLQPVTNKDKIEAGCSQCSHFREMRTKFLNLLKDHESISDSGRSYCPSSSIASSVPRKQDVRNVQHIEIVF